VPISSLPGLVPLNGSLLEDGRRPDFRDVFGHLAQHSTGVDTAVTRIRLSTIDLTPDEVRDVVLFRVIVAEVNSLSIDAEARVLHTLPGRAPNLRFLAHLLECGTLQVRAAPLAGWSPDFTVFSGADGPEAVLCGFHWFERPYPHRGPALASLHFGRGARVARRRFDALWAGAHDIGPALWDIVTRARRSAG
jgi:hypothetical protein